MELERFEAARLEEEQAALKREEKRQKRRLQVAAQRQAAMEAERQAKEAHKQAVMMRRRLLAAEQEVATMRSTMQRQERQAEDVICSLLTANEQAQARCNEPRRCTGGACVVCLDARPTHVLVPCGHKVMCSSCAAKLDAGRAASRRCPICRATIEHITRVWE